MKDRTTDMGQTNTLTNEKTNGKIDGWTGKQGDEQTD
jgi:hypothetical protein